MKSIPMKTVLYTAILVLLVVVFVVQETTRSRRNTIPIPTITETVDQIRIVGRGDEIRFTRNGDDWTMGDERYPVNPDTITALLDGVSTLETVDVVTARGRSEDYGLETDARRTLRLFTGDLEPVALQLGGSAAAGNAIYGRVNGSDEIVLLPTALDTAVALDPIRYREKTMAAIAEDGIVEIRIVSPEFETVRVQRKIDDDTTDTGEASTTGAGNDAASADGAPAIGEPETVETAWAADTAEEIPPARLNALIRELAAVEATGFPEYDEETASSPFAGTPFATVEVERNDGSVVTLDLRPPDTDRRIPVAASSSEYRFYIPEWRARRLLLGLNRYLDPYTEEETG